MALSCGRWIGRLVPSVKNIAKQVRQTISFWKMKDSQKYKIGSHPCWCHYVNGIVIYALPDVEGDGLKFAVHCHDPEIEKEFANEEEFLKVKMDEVKVLMEQYFKGEF